MASSAIGAARIIVESIADESSASSRPGARGSLAATDPAADPCTTSGLVFVISGPSGVGKDTIKQHLKNRGFPLGYCVTATTRPARENEVHGVHYFFVSEAEFDAMLKGGELIEHAINHGRRYGIPFKGLRAGMRRGPDVLVTPDVQGAAALRTKYPGVISIFVAPPHLDELKPRLAGRRSESPEELAIRLDTAAREMERVPEFDYLVINERDRIDQTVDTVQAIVLAERQRIKRRTVTL